MTETPEMFDSFCPRCDAAYMAPSRQEADEMVTEHLKRQIDELHEDALEEWLDS